MKRTSPFTSFSILALILLSYAWTIAGESSLPKSSPEAQGIASAAVLKFIEAADEEVDDIHSFILVRNGYKLAETWWAPYQRESRHMLFSLSKSFTSTAVGLAIEEGKLSLDAPILSFFPEEAPESPSWQLQSMRVRDLLAMSSGHTSKDLKGFSFESEEVLTKLFLNLPLTHKPGTHFQYNTPATYMCSAIVQKVTGEKVIDYLRPRLFEPLGIKNPDWSESPQGISHGGFGLSVRTEDIAHLGQLYLQNGKWNGEQLIPSEWVKAASSRQTSNGSNPESDWDQGYGYQFWRCRHGAYRGDGAFGQYCIVMPEQNAVIAITSGTSDMQKILNLVWDHLLPEMKGSALAPNKAAHNQLERRLQTLQVDPIESGESDIPKEKPERKANLTYQLDSNDFDLTAIKITTQSNGHSTLVLSQNNEDASFVCREGSWTAGQSSLAPGIIARLQKRSTHPIASTGGWIDQNQFHWKLAYTETPLIIEMDLKYDGEELQLDVRQSASFGQRTLPTINGRLQK